jgi:hypothetical protein
MKGRCVLSRRSTSHHITSHSMAFLNQTKSQFNKKHFLIFFRISRFFCGVCCLLFMLGCRLDLMNFFEAFLVSSLHFEQACMRACMVGFFASSWSSSTVFILDRKK